jgi:hypothetical protein
MADEAIIRQWLIHLGDVLTVHVSDERATNFLDSFAPLLAMRFDDAAFTPVSLEHVAAQCKYLPTYGELVPLLQAWMREKRTASAYAALPPPRAESQEPYVPPPAPEWCFDRKPRLLGRHSREEIADLAQKPRRSPAQQYAELTGCPLAEAEAKFGSTMVDA